MIIEPSPRAVSRCLQGRNSSSGSGGVGTPVLRCEGRARGACCGGWMKEGWRRKAQARAVLSAPSNANQPSFSNEKVKMFLTKPAVYPGGLWTPALLPFGKGQETSLLPFLLWLLEIQLRKPSSDKILTGRRGKAMREKIRKEESVAQFRQTRPKTGH